MMSGESSTRSIFLEITSKGLGDSIYCYPGEANIVNPIIFL
jgi:hypothetical protein